MPSGKPIAAASHPKTHCGGAAASQQAPPPRTSFAPRKTYQTDTLSRLPQLVVTPPRGVPGAGRKLAYDNRTSRALNFHRVIAPP